MGIWKMGMETGEKMHNAQLLTLKFSIVRILCRLCVKSPKGTKY